MTYPLPVGPVPPQRRLSWGWIALPILSFGMLSFAVPLVVAAQGPRKRWLFAISGVLGAAAVAAAVLVTGPTDSPAGTFGGFLILGELAVGIAMVPIFRSQQAGSPSTAPVLDPLEAAKANRELRDRARAIVANDPHLAVEAGIGRPDLATHYADGGLVDLNRASAQAIAALPGFDAKLAEKIVAHRAEVGGLTSAADLTITFDVAPTQLDDASERLLFIPL
jgi:hypothetical protein